MIWLGCIYLGIVFVFVAFGKAANRGDRIMAGLEDEDQ